MSLFQEKVKTILVSNDFELRFECEEAIELTKKISRGLVFYEVSNQKMVSFILS
jgi:hypothetical protein